MRRAARVDSNQKQIVADLRSLPGFDVLLLHQLGEGKPDTLVGGRTWDGSRANVLVEIKTQRGKLREAQHEFFDTWPGPVIVARRASDVLRFGFGWPEEEAAKVDGCGRAK